MTKVLTPKEVQEKYHWKPTTWRRRREACLISPYKDAIVLESMRKCHVKEDRHEIDSTEFDFITELLDVIEDGLASDYLGEIMQEVYQMEDLSQC